MYLYTPYMGVGARARRGTRTAHLAGPGLDSRGKKRKDQKTEMGSCDAPTVLGPRTLQVCVQCACVVTRSKTHQQHPQAGSSKTPYPCTVNLHGQMVCAGVRSQCRPGRYLTPYLDLSHAPGHTNGSWSIHFDSQVSTSR